MKLKVKKNVNIPDGSHVGIITRLRQRSKPFEYIDFEIGFKIQGENGSVLDMQIKAGFPAVISENTQLGRLLKRFNIKLVEGEELDLNLFVEKMISFRTFTEENHKGFFSRVEIATIRPYSLINGVKL